MLGRRWILSRSGWGSSRPSLPLWQQPVSFTRCRLDSELGSARVCQTHIFNAVDMAGHFASGRQLFSEGIRVSIAPLTQLRRPAMDNMSEPNRRTVLAATAAAGAFGLTASAAPAATASAPGAAEGES